ncbi:helix-turn-helix transcriptional regulator [Pelotomaculum sp. PtaB.Bin117]|uniref:helix-turn-helix domain-containing protein n=1 Tax=Pelotomaculum sp. PtaB.Bin117 TaxID=1811694 RepID=UPI00257A4E30|nr:helix-turn-helix transcriptional regulator [Pelotomaculum sp. PtaB.Bin117]
MSKWERGLSCPDISLLSKLSHILGVTTSELLNGEKAEPSAPEVDAMVEATLQYADTATKSVIAKNAGWKYVAIVSVVFLLSVLILIACISAIDGGLAWHLLPLRITVFIWLAVMLGVFVMGKNKIASLLLCVFFIYIITFYYSSLNQATTRDISAYGVFNGFQNAYLPHYTIILVVFIVSIAVVVISFWIQNRKISDDKVFLLVANITIMILSELTLQSMVDYVDSNGLGINPKFTILSILTFLMNCVSLAMLAKRHKRQIGLI